MTKPHPDNFCGGNFKDWLEVMLTDKCDGKCSWCIDKNGYHPKYQADWQTIFNKILETKKTNVMFLGGEPTLSPYLRELITACSMKGIKTYVTTNGSLINSEFVEKNLFGLTGLNISIHHYRLASNQAITGIWLLEDRLFSGILSLKNQGTKIRFNCNLIKGSIDSKSEIINYIYWAKTMGADSVRFAELKMDGRLFVNLVDVFQDRYGLTNDPYVNGCFKDVVIDGMPVNFRQMCGMQTTLRARPCDPVITPKEVLYYDGNLYQGWQIKKEEENMSNETINQLKEQIEKLKEQIQKGEKELIKLEKELKDSDRESWTEEEIWKRMDSKDVSISEGKNLIKKIDARRRSNEGSSCSY